MKNLSVYSFALAATLVLMGLSCKKKDDTASTTGGGGNSGNGSTDTAAYKGVSNLPKTVTTYSKTTGYDSTGTGTVSSYVYDTAINSFTYDSLGRLLTNTITTNYSYRDKDNKVLSTSSEKSSSVYLYKTKSVWPDTCSYTSKGNTKKYGYAYSTTIGLPISIKGDDGTVSLFYYSQNATTTNFFYYDKDTGTVTNGNLISKGGGALIASAGQTATYTNYVNPFYNVKAYGLKDEFQYQSLNLPSTETVNISVVTLINSTIFNHTYSFDGNGRLSKKTTTTETKIVEGTTSLPISKIESNANYTY